MKFLDLNNVECIFIDDDVIFIDGDVFLQMFIQDNVGRKVIVFC